MTLVNPLLEPGTVFDMELMNPNPTSSKTKDGPAYRISFEVQREAWDWFMEAQTRGMLLAAKLCRADGMSFPEEQQERPGTKEGADLASRLDASKVWHNINLWTVLCHTELSREKYRKWVALQNRCYVCGAETEDRHPHHWREQVGTGRKPADCWCIPLCCKHHTGDEGVHTLGAQTWAARFIESNKLGHPKYHAMQLMAAWNREAFKQWAGIKSMREVTQAKLDKFHDVMGVKLAA